MSPKNVKEPIGLLIAFQVQNKKAEEKFPDTLVLSKLKDSTYIKNNYLIA